PGTASGVELTLRGIPIVFDLVKSELLCQSHRAPAPLVGGHLQLRVLLDRTSIEIFVGEGRSYVPMPAQPRPEIRTLSLSARGGTARIVRLEVAERKSAGK